MIASTVVELWTTMIPDAATPPNVTAAPVWKPVPVIVTTVLPARMPRSGLTDATVGGASGAITNAADARLDSDAPPPTLRA